MDLEKKNKILKRNINLNENLDCFILISSDDHRLTENLLDISIEHLVDKISKEDTYNDFSIALEHINSYLKTWKKDQKESYQVDMII
ncbi:MAG: hypothetical protein P1U46_04065 [Patescibacteria group bacterium]|nr:hypothetical protein [Patescibacteria group bacterium]